MASTPLPPSRSPARRRGQGTLFLYAKTKARLLLVYEAQIEDAWVLAESLARDAEPEQAFAAYQRVRQAKATMIVNRSWQMGKLAHLKNPLGRALRNALIRGAPPSLGQKQFDALYTLNY
jgi:hypothetical protein